MRVKPTIEMCDKRLDILANERQSIENKIQRQTIKRDKTRLEALVNPNNVSWAKYAYLGLYSGIYGLLCLLIVGMHGSNLDHFLHDFLIVSAQGILILEFLTLIQLRGFKHPNASMHSVIHKVKELACVLIVVGVLTALDLTFHVFPDFETPFLWSSIIIVYLPFLVFLCRIGFASRQIRNAEAKCKKSVETRG